MQRNVRSRKTLCRDYREAAERRTVKTRKKSSIISPVVAAGSPDAKHQELFVEPGEEAREQKGGPRR